MNMCILLAKCSRKEGGNIEQMANCNTYLDSTSGVLCLSTVCEASSLDTAQLSMSCGLRSGRVGEIVTRATVSRVCSIAQGSSHAYH